MSSFALSIPAAPRSPPLRFRGPLPSRARGTPPSILLVGARVADRSALAGLLRRAGYGTREEPDGAGALEAARESPPDLVIVGTLTSGMGAEEFTGRMRAEESLRRVPLLLHSSSRRGSDARRVDDGSGLLPVAAMRSDPAALLGMVERLFGRAAPPSPGPPDTGLRTLTGVTVRLPPVSVRLPPITVAACLVDLRAFHAEIGRVLDEGVRIAARRERHRALEESMRRTEVILEGVRVRLASVLELGVALAGRGAPGALDELLAGASRDLLDTRVALLAHLAGPGPSPVPVLALVPGLLPLPPPPGMPGTRLAAILPLLVPVAGVVPLPVLTAAIHGLGAVLPGTGTITLDPIALAGAAAPEVLLVAGTLPLVLDVTPGIVRVRRLALRDAAGEFDEPVAFEPADIRAFHRIVEGGETAEDVEGRPGDREMDGIRPDPPSAGEQDPEPAPWTAEFPGERRNG